MIKSLREARAEKQVTKDERIKIYLSAICNLADDIKNSGKDTVIDTEDGETMEGLGNSLLETSKLLANELGYTFTEKEGK